MKRVAFLLTMAALVFTFPITGAAQKTGVGQTSTRSSRTGTTTATTPGQTTGDRAAVRAELEKLRQDLQKDQRLLKEKETALRAARNSHDRAAAERLTNEIKTLKQEIERIQRRIKELSRGR